MNFERAYAILASPDVEGGLSDRNLKDDPGGLTKFGISQKAYPKEDIRNITPERAKFLTKRDYWDTIQGDFLPWPIALTVFDMAFNSGVLQAVRTMQQALGVRPDGIMGPKTLEAAKNCNPKTFVIQYMYRRFIFMHSLRNWAANRNGWMRRLFIMTVNAVT